MPKTLVPVLTFKNDILVLCKAIVAISFEDSGLLYNAGAIKKNKGKIITSEHII